MPGRLATLRDACGLPWLEPRAELVRRYGISSGAGGYSRWEVVAPRDVAPLLEGLRTPLWAQYNTLYCPDLPAIEFRSSVSTGATPRGNLERAVDALSAQLGPGDREETEYRATHVWREGAAKLELSIISDEVFERNAKANRIYAGDLDCYVTWQTGFRPPLTADETKAAGEFVAFADLPLVKPGREEIIRCTSAEQSVLEYTREPELDLRPLLGKVGWSRDRRFMIFCTDQLYLVPMSSVIDLGVTPVLPAQGPGGAFLTVSCWTDWEPRFIKHVHIAHAPRPGDLDEIGPAFADALGRPFEFLEEIYDA